MTGRYVQGEGDGGCSIPGDSTPAPANKVLGALATLLGGMVVAEDLQALQTPSNNTFTRMLLLRSLVQSRFAWVQTSIS